jgi:hypothetical protein
LAVESDVDGAVVERAPPSGPSIVRGKDAADEGDDSQRVLSVIADRVYVPPGIAARIDLLVEPRSWRILSAASRPESAAIGAPGPG